MRFDTVISRSGDRKLLSFYVFDFQYLLQKHKNRFAAVLNWMGWEDSRREVRSQRSWMASIGKYRVTVALNGMRHEPGQKFGSDLRREEADGAGFEWREREEWLSPAIGCDAEIVCNSEMLA
jgi:hypothetical protein